LVRKRSKASFSNLAPILTLSVTTKAA